MNDLPALLTLDIAALSHDGRGVARLAAPKAPSAPDAKGGAVVFVAGALPGQRVSARVLRRKSSFIEAETVDVLRQAADAVPPICPHHAECGGCPLQTIPYARQLHWKRAIALDALTRIGRLDRAALENMLAEVNPSPAQTRYRNKMEFAFGVSADGELALGLRRRNGRDVVNVPGCALMPPEALAMTELARNLARQSGLTAYTPPEDSRFAREAAQTKPECARRNGRAQRNGRGGRSERRVCAADSAHGGQLFHDPGSGFWRFLIIRRGLAADLRTPRLWALCITSPANAAEKAAVRALGRELLAAFPQLTAFIHEERSAADALAFGEKRVQTLNAAGVENSDAARLHLPLAGTFFTLDAASFFQVNTAAAQSLAHIAASMFSTPQKNGGARGLLDLYCGVGAPGLTLAGGHEALLGLEQDARAIMLARANAAALPMLNCRYETGDAAAMLERLGKGGEPQNSLWQWTSTTQQPGTQQLAITRTDALVDPPRAGLSTRALDALLNIAPERILYISCNPATLARDAARLRERYALERLAAVDMFPHTPHVECLTLWRRRS